MQLEPVSFILLSCKPPIFLVISSIPPNVILKRSILSATQNLVDPKQFNISPDSTLDFDVLRVFGKISCQHEN